MQKYIGTKEVEAESREALQHSALNPAPGYAVKYPDGYESWSPKDVFEAAYRKTEGDGQALTFGDALHFLKQGGRVARAGWNGKGMWLEIHHEQNYKAVTADGISYPILDWIGMKTVDDKFVPWLCSQTDALAEDWSVLA